MKYMFKFPDIGEGLEEGKIIEWYVEKGQSVSSGDALVKMETDKVVTDIPSPKTGIISQRFGGVGDTIRVGSVLVEIDIPGVEGEAAQVSAQTKIKAPAEEVVEEKGFGVVGTIEVAGDGAYLPSSGEGMEPAKTTVAADKTRKVLSTPVARAMARELGIDINSVTGTGPANRVTKKDIENHEHKKAESRPVHPLQSDEARTESVPLSMIRKTIAKNMIRSKQNAAHMSVMDEVEVSELVAARAKLNARLEKDGVRISYLPFVIKAVGIALKHHPIMNAELDLEGERVIYKNYINIGIAVDTEEGLVVPVIKDADKKSLIQLATELSEISSKSQERKLTLNDMKDGTFSITSYGSIGGYFAVPVINYPQAAILGIGKLVEKPVVKDGAVVVGKILPISMSVDHRLVDGGIVARFLNEVLEYLHNPMLMLAYEGVNHAL